MRGHADDGHHVERIVATGLVSAAKHHASAAATTSVGYVAGRGGRGACAQILRELLVHGEGLLAGGGACLLQSDHRAIPTLAAVVVVGHEIVRHFVPVAVFAIVYREIIVKISQLITLDDDE